MIGMATFQYFRVGEYIGIDVISCSRSQSQIFLHPLCMCVLRGPMMYVLYNVSTLILSLNRPFSSLLRPWFFIVHFCLAIFFNAIFCFLKSCIRVPFTKLYMDPGEPSRHCLG